mgnify:CR=1 FL=1
MKYINATSDDYIKSPTPSHLNRTPWGTFANASALGMNATGYGKKITTIYKVPFNGRFFRVYATCFSNCASHWIMSKGEKLFVRS